MGETLTRLMLGFPGYSLIDRSCHARQPICLVNIIACGAGYRSNIEQRALHSTAVAKPSERHIILFESVRISEATVKGETNMILNRIIQILEIERKNWHWTY